MRRLVTVLVVLAVMAMAAVPAMAQHGGIDPLSTKSTFR